MDDEAGHNLKNSTSEWSGGEKGRPQKKKVKRRGDEMTEEREGGGNKEYIQRNVEASYK